MNPIRSIGNCLAGEDCLALLLRTERLSRSSRAPMPRRILY